MEPFGYHHGCAEVVVSHELMTFSLLGNIPKRYSHFG